MSRASELGVKTGPLKRATAARIKKAKALMAELAGLWGDIDEAMVNEADHLTGRLEEMEATADASFELLREEWPA